MKMVVNGWGWLFGAPSTVLNDLDHKFRIDGKERIKAKHRLRALRVDSAHVDMLFKANDYLSVRKILAGYLPREEDGGRLKSLTNAVWRARGADEFFSPFVKKGDKVRFPRGLANAVRKETGCEIIDWRSRGENYNYGAASKTCREYQGPAVEAALLKNGLLVAPTGSGKTPMGAIMIERLKKRALVIVPSKVLANQWVEEGRETLGVAPSLYGMGKRDLGGPFVVATVQTLGRDLGNGTLRRKDLDPFGLVIDDEAHRAASPRHMGVIGACSALHRVGLTATPDREDGMSPVVRWVFGPVVAEIPHEPLYQSGHLLRPTVEVVRLSFFESDFDPSSMWADFLGDLCRSEDRNFAIAGFIKSTMASREAGLALCARVEHAEKLAEILCGMGLRASPLHGGQGVKAQRKALEGLKEGELDVVTATSIADEGLNIKAIDTAYTVSAGRSMRQTIQRIGRIMRPLDGKKPPVWFEMVDYNIPALKAQYYTRRKAYKAIGATIKRKHTHLERGEE